MERPKIKDFMYTDPQMVELLGDDTPDIIEFAKANKKYIDYLEANSNDKIKVAGYLFNGRFYKSLDELKGKTMSKENQPKPLYF